MKNFICVPVKFHIVLNNCLKVVGAYSDMDLNPDGIPSYIPELLDFKVLIQPFAFAIMLPKKATISDARSFE